MNKLSIRFLPGFARFALLIGATFAAQAADLTVRVKGPATGQVYIALYDKEETWSKRIDAIRFDRGTYADGYTTVFKDLPGGTYAVSLFVDTNDNAKLDLNPAGMPLEPYGISRNARGQMGPPAFRDAAIDFGEDAAVTINLR
jgi:uncharacterized protein (DUF2141 family)